MNEVRNEIKSYIVRRGMTMNDVVALLADEYGWTSPDARIFYQDGTVTEINKRKGVR